jgi:hypothetical protein
MKRPRSKRGEAALSEDDDRLAREFLEEVRQGWRKEKQAARARIGREVLEANLLTDIEPTALWTRYRLVCLELLGGGRTGRA